MPTTTTSRGFSIYADLVDRYGSRIRVQESSLATEACVWIFASSEEMADPSPHLTVEQARVIRDALTEFVNANADDGATPTAPTITVTREQLAETLRVGGIAYHREHDKEWRDNPWKDGINVDLDGRALDFLVDYVATHAEHNCGDHDEEDERA